MSRRLELKGAEKTALYERVLARADWRCENQLCRKKTALQVDHHVPRSQLGPDSEENLCVLCEECHRLKGDGILVIVANGDGTFRFHDLRRVVCCEGCGKRVESGEVLVPTPNGGRRWARLL